MLPNSTFICICLPGRSGRFCELIDPCVSSSGTIPPCRNGGTCVRLGGTAYACVCSAGFTGLYCDISNPCSSMPCSSNATCVTLMNGTALCLCPPGTTGFRCDQPLTSLFCASSPCRNNGTCVDTICICPNNTSGPTCNVTRVPCPTSTRPTLTCLNGGVCVPGVGCICEFGFGGDDCGIRILNSCTISSCVNGGSCRQLLNGSIVCICPIGFTGLRCETVIPLCSPNPCQFNGTCVPSGTTGYICICLPNFTGPRCNLVANQCLYVPCESNDCFSCTNFDVLLVLRRQQWHLFTIVEWRIYLHMSSNIHRLSMSNSTQSMCIGTVQYRHMHQCQRWSWLHL
jgi:hypothetical protein